MSVYNEETLFESKISSLVRQTNRLCLIEIDFHLFIKLLECLKIFLFQQLMIQSHVIILRTSIRHFYVQVFLYQQVHDTLFKTLIDIKL